MRLKTAILAPLLLAACVVTPRAPEIGQVTVGAQSYPVVAAPSGGWRVMIDGQPVPCLHPDLQACTHSARNHLQARAALDDLG